MTQSFNPPRARGASFQRAAALVCGVALAALSLTASVAAEGPAKARPAAEPLIAGGKPQRLIVNPTEDPSRGFALTWRMEAGAGKGLVEYAEATPGPAFEDAVQTVMADSEVVQYVPRNGAPVSATAHSAVVQGLKPETLYVYRVGDGRTFSAWRQIRTAAASAKPFSFLYFGDVQNEVESHGSRVMRMARRLAPDAALALYAGDLINRSDADREWGEWFDMAPDLHAELLTLPSPGNHEYGPPVDGRQPLAPQWRQQFTLPLNGPAGVSALSETVYQVDYQGVRFLSLDADAISDSPELADVTLKWLEARLTDNPNAWTVVFLHYPIYSTAKGRDNAARGAGARAPETRRRSGAAGPRPYLRPGAQGRAGLCGLGGRTQAVCGRRPRVGQPQGDRRAAVPGDQRRWRRADLPGLYGDRRAL
jgi:acid phosphatase type 7